ncbi:MAG: O-antigen ligase family protein [Rhodobacteraceae bacterium]|nr:O-antigen ligase family protein [Paracoccaceae bacterium]
MTGPGRGTAMSRQPSGGLAILDVSPGALLSCGMILSLLTINSFGSLSVLAFLGFLALVLARAPGAAAAAMISRWWILLVPAWCVLSVLWSDHPLDTLRHGLQLGITFVAAVALAGQVPPRKFLHGLWCAVLVAAVASATVGHVRENGDWIGIFGSKNAFSQPMSILVIASWAMILDRGEATAWRLLSAAGFVLGSVLLYLASSAGGALATAVGLGAATAFHVLRPLSGAARIIATTAAVLLMAGAVTVILAHRDPLMALFLEATGKDVTLTGRTDLWAVALEEIRARPLTGTGFNAFWVVGNPVAESLWAAFRVEAGAGFNFHNTWLSNTVEIGLPGILLEALVFGGALVLTMRWALAETSAAAVFLAATMIRQALLSLVEVVAYSQFEMLSFLSVAALVYGLRAAGARRRATRPAATRPGRRALFRSVRRGGAVSRPAR